MSVSLATRPAARLHFDSGAALAVPGSLAIVVSLFLPWLTVNLSACAFSACTSPRSQTFSLLEMLTASGMIHLVGGPLTALLPVVAGYTQLAWWCLGTAVFGLGFAGYRCFGRRPPAYVLLLRPPRRSWLAVLLSLMQVGLVGMTLVQVFSTFARQETVTITALKLVPGSVLQPGPAVLLAGLLAGCLAALLGLRAGWSVAQRARLSQVL